jgi:glycine/D-amino acid oxidase-like deaminating enzyme
MPPMTASARLEERPLPKTTSVVVIGGGIVGVTAAIFLAEAGIPVVLCEKGRIGAEQSSRNWGWIRTQGRDLGELPLMLEAMKLWHRLKEEAGRDIGFRVSGATYLAEDDAAMAVRAAWLEKAKAFGVATRLLSSVEVDNLLGQNSGRFKGGIHTPTDACAEPDKAMAALADLARRKGVQVFEGVAVRSIERVAGHVSGVITEKGGIACDGVILAGGVWTRPFLENMGVPFPQLGVKSSAQATTSGPEITPSVVGSAGASFRRRQDGGYTIARSGAARMELIPAAFRYFRDFLPLIRRNWRIIDLAAGRSFFGPLGVSRWADDRASPMERARILDPKPDGALLDDVLRKAGELFPQLQGLKPVKRWAGMIDVTPDEMPVIDTLPGCAGLVLATGCSGHGFGLGPGVGYLASQFVRGEAPIVDAAAFRYGRFPSTLSAAKG